MTLGDVGLGGVAALAEFEEETLAVALFVEGVLAGREQVADNRRHGASFLCQAVHGLPDAERVPDLKRAQAPSCSPTSSRYPP